VRNYSKVVMKEIGIINRGLAKIISEQGHHDLLMVVDAGFAIPKGLEVVDLSFAENKPMVIEVLTEIEKYFSVEKMIMANQTKEISPTLFSKIKNVWGGNIDVDMIDHSEFRQKAKEVKAVIRTGDFTAYGNVILVSGAGERWYCEIQ
jgi:D-ribose pyranase